MNIYQFMSDSPYLTFFLACVISSMIAHMFYYPIKRYLRSRDIQKHGWPPLHCDSDGDFKEDK